MRKKSNIIFMFLIVILVVIFSYSAYKVILWKLDNDRGKTTLESLREDIVIKKRSNGEEEYKIDFASLKKKNSDTVAYMKINGTNIDYPIVKASDNAYYLNHSFDKSSNGAGWPFANYLNKFDGTDKNISIFGHARIDGSMFGTLYKTLSRDWQNVSDNHKITFITEAGTFSYQVFSTYKIAVEDYYLKTDFKDDAEYSEFLKALSGRSNYNYNVDLEGTKDIITLSSCANDDKYRIVLHARKINS